MCVPRSGKPVVHGRADFAALHRRVTRTMMAGDQQQNALTAPDRVLESTVDRAPCAVEVHAMQIEHAVGLDVS